MSSVVITYRSCGHHAQLSSERAALLSADDMELCPRCQKNGRSILPVSSDLSKSKFEVFELLDKIGIQHSITLSDSGAQSLVMVWSATAVSRVLSLWDSSASPFRHVVTFQESDVPVTMQWRAVADLITSKIDDLRDRLEKAGNAPNNIFIRAVNAANHGSRDDRLRAQLRAIPYLSPLRYIFLDEYSNSVFDSVGNINTNLILNTTRVIKIVVSAVSFVIGTAAAVSAVF